ncbi:MAG: Methenyltetrahydrofolate cyclohydrolase / Methylenetetrahydrofolate dehydrogenase (NADP+) [uncultured Thermomicrobiales bacterium]|uniref:Bifunctional protein FolD n=1 Tax=uncultured Thermomicrobiales bacterium TaxID=1645740 RepID=A0A6J4VGP3_9BACT|nr:MAG: Methenyltetrahydrofolate cyclohydrolase / Methylenetetrahydrofolate dehydrogenase (NADP+) [uncultured Thermomicrobiales bacterium]
MTAIEMRGKRLEPTIATEILRQSDRLPSTASRPLLATVLVGDDPAAQSYRASIARTFRRVGVAHRAIDLHAGASDDHIFSTIDGLNGDRDVTGIMLFLPLPGRRADRAIRELVSPLKDVDGITVHSTGLLRLGRPCLEPACPRAGVALLQAYGVELAGRTVAVIGRSPVVGGPLAAMLTAADATVTVAHRQTRDLPEITRAADIIACAAGHPSLLTSGMVRRGATVLDFGTNVVDGHLRGDADFADLLGIAGRISPVPGGTGPATALVLAYQTMLAAHAQASNSLDILDQLPSVAEVAEAVGRDLTALAARP